MTTKPCPQCSKQCYPFTYDLRNRARGDQFDIVTYRYHFRCDNCHFGFDADDSQREELESSEVNL